MSTTLTNGLKLPDKGSVDWYADMQNNYSILDGAVGTIAEHTTALAGKAPLVHTHSKSDITDFPVYGTTAGTICEGNDSRLSDARTPVAHTHTKSDVTDLFNSANTWSGENSFTAPCKTLGKKLLTDITDLDDAYYNGEVCEFNPNTLHNPTSGYGDVLTINNAVNRPDNIYSSWITQIAATAGGGYLGVRNRSNGGAWTSWTRILTEDHAVPTVTNTYDLGSSSYQWNNLYAKNYYYNGVAWGLDKYNYWLKNQSFMGEQLGNEDSAHTHTCLTLYGRYDTVQSSGMIITRMRSANSQGGLGETSASRLGLDVLENGVRTNNALLANIKGYNSETGLFTRCELYTTLASSRLGTSSNPWKLINDVNPGALSLPNFNNADPIDTRNWVINTPTNNTYTPSESGWLNVVVTDSSPSGNEFSLYIKSTNFFASAVHKLGDIDDSKGKVGLFIPVIAGITYYVVVKSNTSNITISATLYPCFGSV